MFSLGKRAHGGKPVFLADIDSGSVAVSVAIVGEEQARVLISERSFLSVENRDAEHTTAAIVQLLSDVTARIAKTYSESEVGKKEGPVSALYAVTASPWVRSRTSVAEEVFQEEKHVTDALIKTLAKRALQEPSPLESSRVFESSVTRVQLNGYSTGKPVGKRAHHVSVTALQSDIDSNFKQGIENALHQTFPGRNVDFRSNTRVALTSLHERAPSHHYMLFAMGAAATDCIAVHKEDTSDHTSASVGVSTIAKRLAGESGLPEETFSLMRMLMNDTCSDPACGVLKANLATYELELVKVFGDMFASIATHRKVPNDCFLVAHADFMPWLEHFLTRIDFAQFTVTAQPLSVVLLSPEHLRNQVVWEKGAREDTNIALAAAFVNSIHH